MSTVEKITAELYHLRPQDQAEVLEFVEFLKSKRTRKEDDDFQQFSLANAMRGLEEEPDIYSAEDIRESIK